MACSAPSRNGAGRLRKMEKRAHRFSALPDNLPAKRTLLGNGMGDALPVVQHQFMGDLADAVALSDIEAF